MPHIFFMIYTPLISGVTCEMDDFLLHDGYLFKCRKLCIPVPPYEIFWFKNYMSVA